jgi:cytochrome c556
MAFMEVAHPQSRPMSAQSHSQSPHKQLEEEIIMTSRSFGVAMALTVLLGVSLASASGDPIKDREELMKGNGKAVKGVVAMLKGEKPYDGAAVEKAMKDINGSLATFVTLFPEGSETGEDTEAKPEIWQDKADFESKAKDLQAATAKAAAAAPGGLDAFKVAFGAVGKACKACHEKYREEKKD